MIDEFVNTLVVGAPAAAAVIVVVWLFLKDRKEANAVWASTIEKMSDQSHATEQIVADALRKMAEAQAASLQSQSQTQQLLAQLVSTVERIGNGVTD